MLKNPSPISHDPRWRELIFGSSPAREVMGRSRPTMRFRTFDVNDAVVHEEGGNEYTAWLLLSLLLRIGLVRRFKFQPFNLLHYGGPNGFPDLLVEMAREELVVVEVKSAKYITAEFLKSLQEREALIKSMGMACRLWSDKAAAQATPALNINIRNNLLEIDRCKEITLERDLLETLRKSTINGPITLAALLDTTGAHWDQLMSALAANHISINIEKKLHETSLVKPPAAPREYEHYFSQRAGFEGWWRSLPDIDLDHHHGSA